MWKQPKSPLMDEWINKLWYIHTMGCCTALRKKEIQILVTTWMNLEDIMVSEISQSQKDKWDPVIPLK